MNQEIKEAIKLIEKIKDQANRATVVQDRSVGIIKQTCGYIFSECVQVLTLLRTEQPPVGESEERITKEDYPNSEFTKIQRLAIKSCVDSYEGDEWLPIGLQRLAEACDIIDASKASKADLQKEITDIRPYADCYKRICESLGIEKDILGFIENLKASRKELLEAFKQIKVLNADKDSDIKWLCEAAISKTTKDSPEPPINPKQLQPTPEIKVGNTIIPAVEKDSAKDTKADYTKG